jgi:hypothetical protein
MQLGAEGVVLRTRTSPVPACVWLIFICCDTYLHAQHSYDL